MNSRRPRSLRQQRQILFEWLNKVTRTVFRRKFALRAVIITVLSVITALAFHTNPPNDILIEVGEEWPFQPVVADLVFAVDKPPESLLEDQIFARRSIEPIFVLEPTASERTIANLDTLQAQLNNIMEAYLTYQQSLLIARPLESSIPDLESWALAMEDSVEYDRARQRSRIFLSDAQWRFLARDYALRDTTFFGTSSPSEPEMPLYQYSLDWLWTYITQYVQAGIVGDIVVDSLQTEFVKVRNPANSTFERIPVSQLSGQEQIYEAMGAHLAPYYLDSPELNPAQKFVDAVFVATLSYDAAATERSQSLAAEGVSTTRGVVAEDQIIVRRGEEVTPEIKQQLESLRRLRLEQNRSSLFDSKSAGKGVLALCIYAIFFWYLFVARREIFDSIKDLLMISILFAVIVGLFAIAVRQGGDMFMLAVPVALVSLELTAAYDNRVGWFSTMAIALLGGIIVTPEHSAGFILATIVAGSLVILMVPGARTRSQFFAITLVALAGYAVVFLGMSLFTGTVRLLPERLAMAALNTFLLNSGVPLMWLLERAFNVTSDLRLVELSDYNRPLLKRLQQEAPGTFNHSMQVARLAEAGARVVEANVLLVRVGAYYHDVGKLRRPLFFIENLSGRKNPHDNLSPQDSAEIIIDHVTYGLELADEHRLPNNLKEFIASHHGTSLTAYFYYQAINSGQEVEESDFRYAGPKPSTKEAAILMLADGVEAACNSLDDPSKKNIEDLVNSIFRSRIKEGELDDSGLTFKDSRLIRDVMNEQLFSIYHGRRKPYPGQKK